MKEILLFTFIILIFTSLAAAQCEVTISAQSTDEFLEEIPDIDKELEVCPIELPFPADWLFNNEKVAVNIEMTDGTTETVIVEVEDGSISGVTVGGTGTGYNVTITECGLDTALRNGNTFGVYSYLYQEDQIMIDTASLGKRITMTIAGPVISFTTQRAQTPVTIECT